MQLFGGVGHTSPPLFSYWVGRRPSSPPPLYTPLVTKKCTLKELHDTMGHCNVSDFLKLQAVVHGIKINYPDDKFFCNICCKGKMTHSAISKKPDERAKKPLDMVHSDLVGPITPTAMGGFVYAIVIVDYYSGMTFHYF